jgi:hypothetical protein
MMLWIFNVREMHDRCLEIRTSRELLMPCGDTAGSEKGVRAFIIAASGLLIRRKNAGNKQGVGLFSIAAGIFARLVPAGMYKSVDYLFWRLTRIHYQHNGSAIVGGAFAQEQDMK